MIRFNIINDNLTISSILQHTYRNNSTRSRFNNSDRDCLPSTIKIVQRIVYKKNKEGKFSAPEERLVVISKSAPQYSPYIRYKSKNAQKQMKYKHQYDVILCIQPINDKKEYSLDSKIVWRVGSYKKWESHPKQKYIKSIYHETREKLKHKYRKLSVKEQKDKINDEIEKIKKNAQYLSIGDYNSRVNGCMGDAYFRDYWVQQKYGCLYGPCWYQEDCENIKLPFFDKHMLCIIFQLIKKGTIKTN